MMASTDMIKTVMNAVKVRLNSLTAKISKLEDGVKINSSNIENGLNELPKKMDKTNPVATGSFSLNRMNGSVVGTNSFAEGHNTTASGNGSHAEGTGASASGDHSHAEGHNTTASAEYSHAEGYNTTASGNGSHAEGAYTTASGVYSHVEGNSTTASGDYSHAEGSGTKALDHFSHTEGYKTTASGIYSHAEGHNTTASGNGSHAEGAAKEASGESSHAEGYNTTASGNSSHAEGFNTTTLGKYSHAEGYSTKASGEDSHAEGYNTTASGNGSHAEGTGASASGDHSHAEGNKTKASGNGSHSEGYHTTAGSSYQHVQGKYNIFDANNKYAHIVGNGTSNDNLSNAHTLDWKGNAWFAGTVEGKSVILSSSATDSTKKFKVTVDDTGEPTFTDTSDSTNSWIPYSPPTVTSDDVGKLLRVSSTGEWAAESISNMEEFNQLAENMAGKLSEPAEGLAVGKYFRVAALDENGHAVLEAVDAKTVGVQDVQVNGESIVADGVAAIPNAGVNKYGMVKLTHGDSSGTTFANETIYVVPAFNNAIDNRKPENGYSSGPNNRHSLVPAHLDYAVKAAMCDGKGAAWTSDEQAAARERMGIPGEYELIEEITLEEDVTIIVRQKEPDGTPYNFRNVIITAEISTCESKLAGQIDNSSYILGSFTVESGKKGYIKFTGDVINTNSHIVNSQITTVGVSGSNTVTINTTPRVVETPRMLNYLRINAANSVIPSASVIKIYGVRA